MTLMDWLPDGPAPWSELEMREEGELRPVIVPAVPCAAAGETAHEPQGNPSAGIAPAVPSATFAENNAVVQDVSAVLPIPAMPCAAAEDTAHEPQEATSAERISAGPCAAVGEAAHEPQAALFAGTAPTVPCATCEENSVVVQDVSAALPIPAMPCTAAGETAHEPQGTPFAEIAPAVPSAAVADLPGSKAPASPCATDPENTPAAHAASAALPAPAPGTATAPASAVSPAPAPVPPSAPGMPAGGAAEAPAGPAPRHMPPYVNEDARLGTFPAPPTADPFVNYVRQKRIEGLLLADGCGIHSKGAALAMPYRDAAGNVAAVRLRRPPATSGCTRWTTAPRPRAHSAPRWPAARTGRAAPPRW